MPIAAFSATAILAGCSTTLEDLPLPSPGVGADSYRIDAVFTDALNLPQQAKVKLGGVDIGQVQEIDAENYTARVQMAIRSGVDLPTDVRAELRQATPLGDVFVSLSSSPEANPDTPRLRPGATIDVASTSAGASVEELLASASMVVNGGGVSRLQTIIEELDTATAGRSADASHIITDLTATVTDLNQRTDQIDSMLTRTQELSSILGARTEAIDAIAQQLPELTQTLADNSTGITDVLAAAGGAADKLGTFTDEAGPALRDLLVGTEQTFSSVAAIGDDLDVAMKQLEQLAPKLASSTKGNSVAIYVRLSWLSLAALDDPSSHWPGAQDGEDFVGSLTDTLDRVYGRVTGQGLTPVPTVDPPTPTGTPNDDAAGR
ncbi:putative Mce family protein [Rhodococcus sp. AW25M09]|uniref:MCE family protein n=1 Tax=Rhodococcus sp. AW25M09 TaxID=1268303 RepID=UPI0002AD13F0|nr:MCE family protein [Rhodococcus sp. AW25M09]CCQ13513.1 putative Mce family protein [Rhodococcus sp. AW25M09]